MADHLFQFSIAEKYRDMIAEYKTDGDKSLQLTAKRLLIEMLEGKSSLSSTDLQDIKDILLLIKQILDESSSKSLDSLSHIETSVLFINRRLSNVEKALQIQKNPTDWENPF